MKHLKAMTSKIKGKGEILRFAQNDKQGKGTGSWVFARDDKQSRNDKEKVHIMKTHILILFCTLFILSGCSKGAPVGLPGVVMSPDGVPISYEVYPGKDPTLVFVHGWSCDSRYWKEQIPYFAKKYRVVTIDLPGHGHSGMQRNRYTMASFGKDVKAVVDAVGADKVILIGHSLGGGVISQAATLMPEKVIGLVGVDTLHNVAHSLTPKELEGMIGPIQSDFRSGTKAFVSQMILPGADPVLVEWIKNDMASAPPQAALSAMNAYLGQYVTGESTEPYSQIDAPIVSINTDQWPTDVESNRKYMKKYDVMIIKGAGHFLMLENPDQFNKALAKVIKQISNS